MDILIRGGRVIDPAQGIDRHVDVWIVDGKIAALGTDLRAPVQRAQGHEGHHRSPGLRDRSGLP